MTRQCRQTWLKSSELETLHMRLQLRKMISLTAPLALLLTVALSGTAKLTTSEQGNNASVAAGPLQPNSLCAKSERIIFSCLSRRTGSTLAKFVSLCASKDLTKEQGYLQYRYGLPGKVELEYPNSRTGTQQLFKYHHYMRYRVDLTEINFEVNYYQYQLFYDYNGEEKREVQDKGVLVTAPGQDKQVTFLCRSNFKVDFSLLDDVLEREQ
jgi:hypothetical protein